jgi:hypothetical protein
MALALAGCIRLGHPDVSRVEAAQEGREDDAAMWYLDILHGRGLNGAGLSGRGRGLFRFR